MRDDRPVLLPRRQRTHQGEAGAFFILEQARTGKRPAIGVVGLGAKKAGREHHLAADNEAVEAQMVAEKLPTPRLGFRSAAKQAENISPFAEPLRPADKIAEETVEPHHAARD